MMRGATNWHTPRTAPRTASAPSTLPTPPPARCATPRPRHLRISAYSLPSCGPAAASRHPGGCPPCRKPSAGTERTCRWRGPPSVAFHDAAPAATTYGGDGDVPRRRGGAGGGGDGGWHNGSFPSWSHGENDSSLLGWLWAATASALLTATSLQLAAGVSTQPGERPMRLSVTATEQTLAAIVAPLLACGVVTTDAFLRAKAALGAGGSGSGSGGGNGGTSSTGGEPHPFAYRWPSADEPDAPRTDERNRRKSQGGKNTVITALAAASPWDPSKLRPPSSALPAFASNRGRPLDVESLKDVCLTALTRAASATLGSASFSTDAATGQGYTLLAHRFVTNNSSAFFASSDDDGDVLVTVQLPMGTSTSSIREAAASSAVVRIAHRGCTATLSGGGLSSVEVPDIAISPTVTIAPCLGPGLIPTVHATWLPSRGWTLPQQLTAHLPAQVRPQLLDGGMPRIDATFALNGAAASLRYDVRRAGFGAARGTVHALQLLATAGIGAFGAGAVRATYKLRFLRDGVTVGASMGAGGSTSHAALGKRRSAASMAGMADVPAMAFAKTRWANGMALRCYVGLASSVIGGAFTVPEAQRSSSQSSRWVAGFAWADGHIKNLTLTRDVEL